MADEPTRADDPGRPPEAADIDLSGIETVAPEQDWKRRLDEVFEDGWNWVTFDQYGPDGTTLTARIVYWCCPLCGAMVSDDTEADRDSYGRFRMKHYNWHLGAGR